MEKKQNLEIDIELKDLIMEFFRCWKLIVCCALVGGILLGVVSYVNSYKAVNTPAPPVVESAPEPTGQEIIDALTIDELPDVVAAVELKAQIDDKTAYLKDSILMKIDPFQVNRVSLEYLISAENVLSVADRYGPQPYQQWRRSGRLCVDSVPAGCGRCRSCNLQDL